MISSTMTAAEFALVLADDGVTVICGSTTAQGLLDYDDHVVEGEPGFKSTAGAGLQERGELVGRQIIVTVLSDEFADGELAIDQPIEVDGEDYVIRLAIEHSHVGLDTTTLYLGGAPLAPASPGGSVTRYDFTPAPDGTTVTFTAPVLITESGQVVRNGRIMTPGDDYTYTGMSITFGVAPSSTDSLAFYQ